MKVLLKVLGTIIGVPLGIVGAVCLMPFAFLALLVSMPSIIVEDIWDLEVKDE